VLALSKKTQRAKGRALCDVHFVPLQSLRVIAQRAEEEHYARCTSYRCSRCLQSPKEPKEEHYANCTRYRCSLCMKSVKVTKLEHQKKCIGQGWQCPRCCKRLLESKTEHYAKCNGTRYQCNRCFKHPWELKAEHTKNTVQGSDGCATAVENVQRNLG
jgi:DNA-directed RNA polymerase subunit RPC12/RpoP